MGVARSGDVDIHWESYGSGAPLLFIHSFGGSSYAWAFQLHALARAHRCIAMDLRGHGRSGRPGGGFGVPDQTSDALAVLDAADVAKAVLVGNSIGGMIALQTAIDHPDRVAGVVTVNSGTSLGQYMAPEVGESFQTDFAGTAAQLFGNLLVSETTRTNAPWIHDALLAYFTVPENFPPETFGGSAQDPNGVFAWTSDRLGEVKAPTLVVHGRDDAFVPATAAESLVSAIPGARLELIAGAGHYPQLEQPGAFNDALGKFVAELG